MIRQRIAAWLDPEQVHRHEALRQSHAQQAEVIVEQQAFLKEAQDACHLLSARWVADQVEHQMFVADHGRCLHPSREEENP